jgi:hypothetical protein
MALVLYKCIWLGLAESASSLALFVAAHLSFTTCRDDMNGPSPVTKDTLRPGGVLEHISDAY